MSSSNLHARKVSTFSVCGVLVSKGSPVTVDAGKVDAFARKLESRGLLKIVDSNEKGKVQLVCI